MEYMNLDRLGAIQPQRKEGAFLPRILEKPGSYCIRIGQ
jgi:hypothetical protein